VDEEAVVLPSCVASLLVTIGGELEEESNDPGESDDKEAL